MADGGRASGAMVAGGVAEMRDVLTEYNALVAARRTCFACLELQNPSVIANGEYDRHGHIGPWSSWQGRLDADLVVVGQDYSDVQYFEDRKGIEDPKNRTNVNLVHLLGSIGIDVSLPGTRTGNEAVFFTNAILCLKAGGMGAPVKSAWFRECGSRFLRKQLELLPAKAVVALGQRAYDAILDSFRLRRQSLRDALALPGIRLPTGATVIAVYHCSSRVTSAMRSLDRQVEDWHRVRAVLNRT